MYNDPTLKDIIKDVYKKRFNFEDPLPERPEYLIEIESDGNSYGIALEGSVVEFSGMPKARKSSLMAAFVAASLSESRFVMNIRSKIQGNILWIDTEQSEIEFKYFQRMVVKTAGLKSHPANYVALNIRKYDDTTKFAIVDHFIEKLPNLGLIVLDGIADLSIDENEQNSTKALVGKVMAWADERKCPLFVAIHTNKDGKASTGHLGGYIDKRCSYHIRVEKKSDSDPSLVSPKLARMGETFKPFMFQHELGGLPALYVPNPYIGDYGEDSDNYDDSSLPF